MGLATVALILRLIDLGGDSFWIDEIRSVLRADALPFARSVRETFGPLDPPLGFAVEAAARRLPVLSLEAAARLPMALASAAQVVLLWVLLARLLHRHAEATAAATLLALAPFAVRYGQEARYYALVGALHLAGWLLTLEAVRGRRGAIGLWAVVATAAVYTSVFGWLGVLAQLLIGGLALRRAGADAPEVFALRRWVAAGAVPVVAIAPWMIYELAYWVPAHQRGASLTLHDRSTYPVRFDPSLFGDLFRWLLGNGSLLVAAPTAALGIAALVAARSPERRLVVGAWAYLVAVVAATVVLSRLNGTYLAFRRLEFLIAPLLALAAYGGVDLWRRASHWRPGVSVGAALALVATTTFPLSPALIGYYRSEKSDYRSAAAVVLDHSPDLVVLGPMSGGKASWGPPIRAYLATLGVEQTIHSLLSLRTLPTAPPAGVAIWIAALAPNDPRFEVLFANDLDSMQRFAGDDSLIDFIIPVTVFSSTYRSPAELAEQAALVAQIPVNVAMGDPEKSLPGAIPG